MPDEEKSSIIKSPPEPLWLPRGSVRSLLALAIVFATVYMWITGKNINEVQVTILTLILKEYFQARESSPIPARTNAADK